jgi:solute carrier family 35 protein F3/4
VSYNAPFFTTWFCTNWTILFFPLYFICYLISTKCKKPGNIIQESVRNFRDKGFTAGKLKTQGEAYTAFT